MKRSKQIENFIKQVNDYLRLNKIRDEGNDVFLITTHNLLQQNLYKGFNYYKDKIINGVTFSVLAGSDKEFDYLQII